VAFPFFYGKRLANQGMGLAIRNSGELIFASYTDGTLPDQDLGSKGSIPVQVWTHVGLTYSGDTARIYINGILDTTAFRLWNTSTGMLNIGRMGFSGGGQTAPVYFFPYKGVLDDFRIYNRVLNTQEIWNLAHDNFNIVRLRDWRSLESGTGIVYPNPVNNTFRIDGIENILSVCIYNISGMEMRFFANQQEFYDISDLIEGVYYMVVWTKDGFHGFNLMKE
jgi:hypothetical protein